jgi:mono/diheme cytochrome c family protein
MIQEHLEEGIRNIDNCVSCHTASGLKAKEGGERGDDD